MPDHLSTDNVISSEWEEDTIPVLAGILRRFLRGERWWAQEDGDILSIDDSVDLTPGERAAVLQAVREA